MSGSELFQKECKRFSQRYENGNRSKSFLHTVASPLHYEPNFSYPLLVWLHDAGKTDRNICEVLPLISPRNYVAVAPRGIERTTCRVVRSFLYGQKSDEKRWTEPCYDWDESIDNISEAENLVFDSIVEAIGKCNINARRVFLLGQGTGGTMALRVAMRNPTEFAGVVSIDGALPSADASSLRNWRALRDLPVLVTSSGTSSETIPRLDPELLRLYHTAGLTVLVRQYNEDVNAEKGARMKAILSDVNRWVMERSPNPRISNTEMFNRLYAK